MLNNLRSIVENTPGAIGAILMGFDGITVQQFVDSAAAQELDIESVSMEFSLRFIELRAAAQLLGLGDLQDISLKAELGTILVRVLSKEYFVAVLMRDSAHSGKGRWNLRREADSLRSELE